MEFILMPFIFIYHIVSKILSFPKKLFTKTSDKVIENQDRKELQKEAMNTESLISQNQSYMQPAMNGQQVITTGNPTNSSSVDDAFVGLSKKEYKAKRHPLVGFKYTIVNGVGKKETGNLDAESIEDARSFLIQQGYEILNVEERGKLDIDINIGTGVKAADLSFALTQLSTYIKAGIPLVDSVRILAKQTSKKDLKKIFNQIVYELLKGESFSDALAAQGKAFPKLLVNMVRTAEMTGDLASILDDMAEYYTSMDNTRKQMRSAMTYPVVVLTLAFAVLIFMLTYLVPQFSNMFEENGASLPALTQAILNISDFIKNNYIFLIIGIVAVVGIFVYLYKKIKGFRVVMQTIAMHTPIFGKIIIYNEVANFTKTFASLINHGVFITDSMEILSQITNNEVYIRLINKSLVNLGKGETISSAFRGEWAMPIVAYEMIVTGESTGQLGAMMEKVATHFQNLHKNIIDQMKSLIEPLLIVFLAAVVGVILISIVQPMFAIYSTVQ